MGCVKFDVMAAIENTIDALTQDDCIAFFSSDMDGIQQLVLNKDYAALVKACERVELQVQEKGFVLPNNWLMDTMDLAGC